MPFSVEWDTCALDSEVTWDGFALSKALCNVCLVCIYRHISQTGQAREYS